jgi:hypothetical protein
MFSIILFTVITIASVALFTKNVKQVISNIKLGKDVDRSDNPADRIKAMILVAFGQKKMFQRPIPALLHLCIYVAFVITQVELIEIFVDGFTGSHRIFQASLGGFLYLRY